MKLIHDDAGRDVGERALVATGATSHNHMVRDRLAGHLFGGRSGVVGDHLGSSNGVSTGGLRLGS